MKRFEGQNIVITGGSAGIGLEAARQFAYEGEDGELIPIFSTDEQGRAQLDSEAVREVARLAEGYRDAGRHTVAWESARLAPGVYLVRLAAAGDVRLRRAVVVR